MMEEKDLTKAIEEICLRALAKTLVRRRRGQNPNLNVQNIEIICPALVHVPSITITRAFCNQFSFEVEILEDFKEKMTMKELYDKYDMYEYHYHHGEKEEKGIASYQNIGSFMLWYRIHYKNDERIVEDDGKVRLFR